MQYLFIFAQAHADFRIPELQSVAELHGFDVLLPQHDLSLDSPFMIADLADAEHARVLASRCILIRSIHEFYAQGPTYEDLHTANRANQFKWADYVHDTSFKFTIKAHNHTIPQERQRLVVESFSYMGLQGKIDMKRARVAFGCFEEYEDRRGQPYHHKHNPDGNCKQIYFGRLVAEGTARSLIHTFDVKKRAYYGNTSMEAEISLLMANQTLAAPGKMVYDPFMGTGSTAYPAAHFGALVFGSDIDGRQMRGKGHPPGVIRAAVQYGVAQRIVDLCTFDMTRNPWRCGGLFDAIVADPPYGVRAGAKRLGRKKERSGAAITNDRPPRPDDQPYIPPTKPYELSHLARDLVLFARHMLKPHGRLVFFLPTVTDEYDEIDMETMRCAGMQLVANSLQDFGSWGRRLVTIRKTTTEQFPMPLFEASAVGEGVVRGHVPAHQNFREKYFQGFRTGDEIAASDVSAVHRS